MWFFTIKCDVNCRFYFADVFFFSFSLDSLFQGEKFPSDPSLLRVVTMDGVELCQILFVHLLRWSCILPSLVFCYGELQFCSEITFCLKKFLFLLVLKDIFERYRIVGEQFFLSALQWYLTFIVSESSYPVPLYMTHLFYSSSCL